MGVKRQPREIWQQTRLRILERDGYKCVRCQIAVRVDTANIDHIKSGRLATNADSNLRTLCKMCHTTRLDPRHRGMVGKALHNDELPVNWRELLWEDD
jgi:5-methylcytosine-specific restriction protein A